MGIKWPQIPLVGPGSLQAGPSGGDQFGLGLSSQRIGLESSPVSEENPSQLLFRCVTGVSSCSSFNGLGVMGNGGCCQTRGWEDCDVKLREEKDAPQTPPTPDTNAQQHSMSGFPRILIAVQKKPSRSWNKTCLNRDCSSVGLTPQ